MKKKKIISAKLKAQKKAYKRRCKYRYYIILSAYIYEYLVKLLLVALTIPWMLSIMGHNIPLKILSMSGFTFYLIAKCYQLRNMKFRKRGFYDRES